MLCAGAMGRCVFHNNGNTFRRLSHTKKKTAISPMKYNLCDSIAETRYSDTQHTRSHHTHVNRDPLRWSPNVCVCLSVWGNNKSSVRRCRARIDRKFRTFANVSTVDDHLKCMSPRPTKKTSLAIYRLYATTLFYANKRERRTRPVLDGRCSRCLCVCDLCDISPSRYCDPCSYMVVGCSI